MGLFVKLVNGFRPCKSDVVMEKDCNQVCTKTGFDLVYFDIKGVDNQFFRDVSQSIKTHQEWGCI